MHLRNSCTRSTSTCAIRHVPSAASGGLGLKRLMLFFASKVPRDVGDQIPDQRKRAHRLERDRLRQIELVQPGHAHQPRVAVHFGRAGSALAGLAVPADGEVVRLLGLDLMHGVEHDHPLGHLGRVVLEPAARCASPRQIRNVARQSPSLHLLDDAASARRASPGSARARLPSRRRGLLRTMKLNVPKPASLAG